MTAIRNNARAVVIHNDRILLVKSLAHGFYFLPGGGIDFGQTVAETVCREFIEEAGMENVIVEKTIGVFENIFTFNGEAFHSIEHLVTAILPHHDVVSIEDHIAFEWVALSDFTSIRYYPVVLAQKILDWHRDGNFILGVCKE